MCVALLLPDPNPAHGNDGPIAVNDRGRAAVAFVRKNDLAVSVRPRLGAPFGSSNVLSPNSSFAAVSVDDGGNVLAVYTTRTAQARKIAADGRLSAPRPLTPATAAGSDVDTAGNGLRLLAYTVNDIIRVRFGGPRGTFGPARTALDGSRFGRLSDVEVSANGEALLFLTGTVVVLGRKDGRFSAPKALERKASGRQGDAALDDRGNALVAWVHGGRVRIAERSAGQSFRRPRTVATARQADIAGVVVGPRGEGAVIWIDHPKTGPARLRGAARTGGRFRRPQTLSDPRIRVERGDLASDGGGNAIATWGGPSFGAFAAFRPAGGDFGGTVVLAPPPRGGSPRSALSATEALVTWSEFDGMSFRSLVASMPLGAGRLALRPGVTSTLTRRRAYAPVRDPGRSCRPPGAQTLLENREIRVYQSAGDTKACFRLSDRSITIDQARRSGRTAYPPPAIALAGPLLLYVSVGDEIGDLDCDDSVYDCWPDTYLQLVDMRLRRASERVVADFLVADERRAFAKVGSVALARDGTLAWITCPGTPETDGDLEPTCRRPGAPDTVYRLKPGGPVYEVLDEGTRIDPSSLRLRGDRFTWSSDGRPRSAPVGT